MADQSLFTSQVPDGSATDGGTPGATTATTLYFTADGNVKGIRFYSAAITSGDTYTVELWECTSNSAGTRLATKSVLGSALSAAPGWSTVLFDTPVTIDTAKVYRAAMHNNHNNGLGETARYVYALNFFASGGLTNGDIVAPQDGVDPGVGFTVNNGNSKVNSAANNFPNGTFSSTCYFVDVVFEASGSSTDYPVSGTIAATSTASLAITADRPVSGAIPAVSTAALAVTADRPVSGTIAASSAVSLAITASRVVSGTIPIVSTASLALVGSAAVWVKRGGAAVLVTSLVGAVKRGGTITPFGD